MALVKTTEQLYPHRLSGVPEMSITNKNLITQGTLNCKKRSLQAYAKLVTFCQYTVTFSYSREVFFFIYFLAYVI